MPVVQLAGAELELWVERGRRDAERQWAAVRAAGGLDPVTRTLLQCAGRRGAEERWARAGRLYSPAERAAVLETARTRGAYQAAREHGVDHTTVRRWLGTRRWRRPRQGTL